MRKLALLTLLLVLPAAEGLAQRGGGRGGFGGHGRGGFHGGFQGGYRSPGFRFGHRGFTGFYRPFYGYGLGYGYSWPFFMGDSYSPFYSSYYSNPYYSYAPPAVTVVSPPPAEPAPPVVVTQYLAPPAQSIPVYQAPAPEPETASGPPLYLIAFKDGVIRAAVAYWTDAGKLHYVDNAHKQHLAPLDTVDREFSARLNQERRVPFRLP